MNDPIARALDALHALVLREPRAAAELDRSAADFFPGAVPAVDDPARRRHLEWFLLERPSETFGEVPLAVLGAPDAGALASDAASLLANSHCGMFEVRDVEAGSGLWLHDLLGLGAYPVREVRASSELAEGDLVVGRIFGAGEGVFGLSPAMAVFRRPGLVEALRRDAERLREGRRGSLRIAQDELERMFFGGPAPTPSLERAAVGPDAETAPVRESSEAPRTRALATLAEADWDEEDRARLVAALDAAARSAEGGELASAAIAEALDRAAFESEVDLDRLRRDLVAWWDALKVESAERTAIGGAAAAAKRPGGGRERAPVDVGAALEAFDRGRAQGKDLDALFRQLERDLELDDDGDEDPGQAPDFPGVVGAMVDEFVWQREQEEPGSTSTGEPYLRALADRTRDIGLFDDLDAQHLVEFAARTAIQDDLCADDPRSRAGELLAALRDFAEWADREHDMSLWIGFRRAHGELLESLPRTAALSRALPRPIGLDWAPSGWARALGPGSVVHDEGRLELELPPGVEGPHEGDWVVGRVRGERFQAAAVLPAEAGRLR